MKIHNLWATRHGICAADSGHVFGVLERLCDLSPTGTLSHQIFQCLVQELVKQRKLYQHVSIVNDTSLSFGEKTLAVLSNDDAFSREFCHKLCENSSVMDGLLHWQSREFVLQSANYLKNGVFEKNIKKDPGKNVSNVCHFYIHSLPSKACLDSAIALAKCLCLQYPGSKLTLRVDTFLSPASDFWDNPALLSWLRNKLVAASEISLDESWKSVSGFTEIADFYAQSTCEEHEINFCVLMIDESVFKNFLEIYLGPGSGDLAHSRSDIDKIVINPFSFVFLQNLQIDSWNLKFSDMRFPCLKIVRSVGMCNEYDEKIELDRINSDADHEQYVVIRKSMSSYSLLDEDYIKRPRKNTILTTNDEKIDIESLTPVSTRPSNRVSSAENAPIDAYTFRNDGVSAASATATAAPSSFSSPPIINISNGIVFEKSISSNTSFNDFTEEPFFPVHVSTENIVSSSKDQRPNNILQKKLSSFKFIYSRADGSSKSLSLSTTNLSNSARRRAHSAAFYLGSDSDSDSDSERSDSSEGQVSPKQQEGQTPIEQTPNGDQGAGLPVDLSYSPARKMPSLSSLPSLLKPMRAPVEEKVSESFKNFIKNDGAAVQFSESESGNEIAEDFIGREDSDESFPAVYEPPLPTSKSMTHLSKVSVDRDVPIEDARSRMVTISLPVRNTANEPSRFEKPKPQKTQPNNKIILIKNTNSYKSLHIDLAKEEDGFDDTKEVKQAEPDRRYFSSPVYDNFFESLNSFQKISNETHNEGEAPHSIDGVLKTSPKSPAPLPSVDDEIKTKAGRRPISVARYKDAVYDNKENKIILVTNSNQTSRLDIY